MESTVFRKLFVRLVFFAPSAGQSACSGPRPGAMGRVVGRRGVDAEAGAPEQEQGEPAGVRRPVQHLKLATSFALVVVFFAAATFTAGAGTDLEGARPRALCRADADDRRGREHLRRRRARGSVRSGAGRGRSRAARSCAGGGTRRGAARRVADGRRGSSGCGDGRHDCGSGEPASAEAAPEQAPAAPEASERRPPPTSRTCSSRRRRQRSRRRARAGTGCPSREGAQDACRRGRRRPTDDLAQPLARRSDLAGEAVVAEVREEPPAHLGGQRRQLGTRARRAPRRRRARSRSGHGQGAERARQRSRYAARPTASGTPRWRSPVAPASPIAPSRSRTTTARSAWRRS